MKYKIEITRNWHSDKRTMFTPGEYRVPEDLSEVLAERAMREGGAKRLEMQATFRAAKRAPVRKALGAAPENKATLDGPVRGGRDGAVADD